ncbi:hypothetical protein TGAM01_v210122 [Trichoderma gamsii]|uniref:Uncharacterized protein n=1 Tax=Trichoderma gamsii TaxID=398673 RepID=A0A2P4Z9S3_9HYPO|nr:hypothetical protein TGAM01_v210122 [Trichoderma gamsii]PON21054.1 hypothetical protein TGAM01_v210122 [Trichoderma gamsii]
MKDSSLNRHELEDAASSSPSNEEDFQGSYGDTKGKQNETLAAAAAHLESSRKLVVNAIATSREMPNLGPESKSSSGLSHLGSSSYLSGESSSYKGHQQTSFEPARGTANECQNDSFDAFIESNIEALVTDCQNGSSFIDQEASDGLAVLELLSHQEDESHSLAFNLEHDSLAPGEDLSWNAPLEEIPSDQEEKEKEERLDFTPDFITRPENSQQAEAYLGIGDIRETSNTWLGYWHDVFTAYNARVWGNSPLETTSRTPEQQGDDSSEPATITRALSRLKLIFHHLKG